MEFDRNKILIVEDEAPLRFGLARCIERAGYLALQAADGPSALEMVSKHMPALLILDVMMYGMSGIEVCRNLKKDRLTSGIKILFLSARGQVREQTEGLAAGGDYYMTKPFEYKVLLQVIEDLLAERKPD